MLAATGNITDLMFGFVSHVGVPYRTSHPHLLVACGFSFTVCDNVFSMDASNNEVGGRGEGLSHDLNFCFCPAQGEWSKAERKYLNVLVGAEMKKNCIAAKRKPASQ